MASKLVAEASIVPPAGSPKSGVPDHSTISGNLSLQHRGWAPRGRTEPLYRLVTAVPSNCLLLGQASESLLGETERQSRRGQENGRRWLRAAIGLLSLAIGKDFNNLIISR